MDVIDVFVVPERLEHAVTEPEGEEILDRFFPQIVIDAIDLLLVPMLEELSIELDRALEVLPERLFDDDEELVRKSACRVADAWDISAGIMMEEDVKLRQFIERMMTDKRMPRVLIPTSLKEHRATWARKLAERLAKDPDPNVRAEVDELYTHWKQAAEPDISGGRSIQ